jgi:putative transposase
MQFNDRGRMIEQWWFELNRKFPMVETDEFVVMPNHLHGILVAAVGADLRVGPVSKRTRAAHPGAHVGAPLQRPHSAPTGARASVSLPTIIQWFKTMTTNQYIRGVKTASWPRFNGRLWQRNYYKHVIRNDDSLKRIRQYIGDNPRIGHATVRIQPRSNRNRRGGMAGFTESVVEDVTLAGRKLRLIYTGAF